MFLRGCENQPNMFSLCVETHTLAHRFLFLCSLCSISSDAALFPPLAEARCLFQGCLDSEGQEDLSLESKPIMRQVLLLRKVSSEEGAGHSYHFRLESRLVAVGCTCIRPVVLHQQ